MILLLLTIVSTAALMIVFKWMKSSGANARQGIMINYAVASLSAYIYFRPDAEFVCSSWFIATACLGVFFYFIFRSIAITTQLNGLTVASITTKMSVLIPVGLGFIVLHEQATPLKLAGISIGLLAVLLSAEKTEGATNWKWIAIAFIGSGLVDASLKLFQHWFASDFEFGGFSVTVFAFAFLTSLLHHLTLPDKSITRITFSSGVILGIVNILSLIFMLNALRMPNWESSTVFPVINFGIVAFSALIAKLVFNEAFSTRKWLSIALACSSIVVLYFSI